jgi:hypothetical protein
MAMFPWSGVENNEQSPSGTIDLHGLYVKEGENSELFCPSLSSPRLHPSQLTRKKTTHA